MTDKLNIAIAQLEPVWLNKRATIEKMVQSINEAATQFSSLVVFGEALLPGYPFWLSSSGGAEFNSSRQKQMFAHYVEESICIEEGDLEPIQKACRQHAVATFLGCVERAGDRSGKSLYCSLVFIDDSGEIRSVHRKLVPTYEERLVWANGDGAGLTAHSIGAFTAGALNCWENWMPMARQALYAQGVDLHVAVWPGSERNTKDITRFIAQESRSYVVSVSGLLSTTSLTDMRERFPEAIDSLKLQACSNNWIANGGSCVASPDGEWLIEPVIEREALVVFEIDPTKVLEERQNFDPAGHYSRPDVLALSVDRKRQKTVYFKP